jgi:cytidylate kinase
LRRTLPELGRKVVGEVARRPVVILAAAAALALPDRPGAVHACLWTPEEWRVAACSPSEMVDRGRAARDLVHADHLERNGFAPRFDVRVDDPALYTAVLDASRVAPDRIVDVLLAAAGKGSVRDLPR